MAWHSRIVSFDANQLWRVSFQQHEASERLVDPLCDRLERHLDYTNKISVLSTRVLSAGQIWNADQDIYARDIGQANNDH